MRHANETRPTTGPPAFLRAARAYADLRIPQMAERIGTSATMLQRWETGASDTYEPHHLLAAADTAGWPTIVIDHLLEDSGES